jgi:ELWxxDGT repeat protein
MFFAAHDPDYGQELWFTDGTPNGTALVADLRPGPTSISPAYLTNVSGTLFFSGGGTVSGKALWKSDGTAAGTVPVKDFGNLGHHLLPRNFVNANGTLFFTVGDFTHGIELWKSDGTLDGTALVKDIAPGLASSAPSGLTGFHNELYFKANDGQHGYELWKSDGTSEGTVMVKDLHFGSAGSNPLEFTVIDERLYFTALETGTGGRQIWKTDGTAADTLPLVASAESNFRPNDLLNVNGTLFFRAYTGLTGYELWKSDGTSQGTVLVKDIHEGAAHSHPSGLMNLSGVLYFAARDATGEATLWRSDGSYEGTWPVFGPEVINFGPAAITRVGNNLLFVADDGIHGRELFTLRYFNSAPVFDKGGDVQSRDNEGSRVVAGWAGDVRAGAPDESSQEVTFEVVADRAELFLEQPRIDDGGNLVFRPKPNAYGTASVTVTLHDDGGTADGGINVSQPQVFNIEVVKPLPWHNTVDGLDVTGMDLAPDGEVTPADALAIINYINAFGAGPLPAGAAPGAPYIDTASAESGAYQYGGDNFISAHDVLAVINWINAFGNGEAGPVGEGEATASSLPQFTGSQTDWLALLAMDIALEPQRRSSKRV